MLNRLPILVDPIHLARRGYLASGVLPLAQLDRLKRELSDDSGELLIDVEFGHDGDRMFLSGSVKGKLAVPCQRCLQPVELPINHHFRLGIIAKEADADWLMENEEPLVATGEEMKLAEIIEDELLLQLPMVSLHERGKCTRNVGLEEDKDGKKDSPFAVLAKLKGKSPTSTN